MTYNEKRSQLENFKVKTLSVIRTPAWLKEQNLSNTLETAG